MINPSLGLSSMERRSLQKKSLQNHVDIRTSSKSVPDSSSSQRTTSVGAECILHENDEIVFGTNKALKYTIKKLALRFCSNNLDKNQKERLKCLVSKLGCHFHDTCFTHLVMNEICLTEKVVLCLALANPIITIEWLQAIVDRNENLALALPDVKSFYPSLSKDIKEDISVFYPDIARKSIFQNKTFVFLSAQQEESFRDIVIAAGGKVISSFKRENDSFFEFHKSNHSCIIESMPTDLNDKVLSEKVDRIKRLGMLLNSQQEIGLAILRKDNEHYCNPKLNEMAPALISDCPEAISTFGGFKRISETVLFSSISLTKVKKEKADFSIGNPSSSSVPIFREESNVTEMNSDTVNITATESIHHKRKLPFSSGGQQQIKMERVLSTDSNKAPFDVGNLLEKEPIESNGEESEKMLTQTLPLILKSESSMFLNGKQMKDGNNMKRFQKQLVFGISELNWDSSRSNLMKQIIHANEMIPHTERSEASEVWHTQISKALKEEDDDERRAQALFEFHNRDSKQKPRSKK